MLKNAAEDEGQRKVCEDTIDLWSTQLAHEGALIASYRVEYLDRIRKAASEVFYDMTGGRERPDFTYEGSCHYESAEKYLDVKQTEKDLLSLLTHSHAREIGAGYTLWGPHKDDVGITLNGVCARLFASQGQQRSLSLAMKLTNFILSVRFV